LTAEVGPKRVELLHELGPVYNHIDGADSQRLELLIQG
jgi:hypothetical protein